MYVILATLFTLLAIFDAIFTVKMLKKYGIDAELNIIIRALCKKLGIENGVILGVGIPTAVLAGGGWFFPSVLSVGTLVRSVLFIYQLRQLHAERSNSQNGPSRNFDE